MIAILRMIALQLAICLFFSLTLAAATPEQDEAAISLLQQRVFPLQQLDHLEPLLRRCASAKLILLGDGTHGTNEFYHLRRLITLQLVKNQQIAFIALEADWHSCRALDRYVRNLPEAAASAREALKGFNTWRSWVWRNLEIALLLDELRTINLSRPPQKRVAVYGLDMLDYGNSLQAIVTIPAYATAAESLWKCLPSGGTIPEDYTRQLLNNGSSCANFATTLMDQAPLGAQIFPHLTPRATFDHAQQLQVVQQGEAYYRILATKPEWAWNVRERHFAQTLHQLRKRHGPAARGIVWAHNTHVGDARATPMEAWLMESLGQLLRQHMGAAQVVLVGQTGFSGTVYAGPEWGSVATVLPVPPAAYGSTEELLHRCGFAIGMWIFTGADTTTALNIPRGQRAIGVSYDPNTDASGNYVLTQVTQRYDVLIFVDQISYLLPLTSSQTQL